MQNANRLTAFLNRAVTLLDYAERDAQAAREIRAALERQGTRIGDYGTPIAGQAFARNLILVTANAPEFERVRGPVVRRWWAKSWRSIPLITTWCSTPPP